MDWKGTGRRLLVVCVVLIPAGCAAESGDAVEGPMEAPDAEPVTLPLAPDQSVAQITGLSGPEAVRFDPDRDVYYIANFNGDAGERDGNGFIARASADGTVTDLEFLVGTDQHPLHAPRGMNIESGISVGGRHRWRARVRPRFRRSSTGVPRSLLI